jgi:hypothetical protein
METARPHRRAVNQQPPALDGIVFRRGDRRVPDAAYQELAELWEAVFGEQPSVVAEPGLTARILVDCLPQAEPYGFVAKSED